MKKLTILIIGVLFLCSCGAHNTSDGVKEMSKLDNILKENNYLIVDVRTSDEYKSGHVKKSINIPYDEITESKLLNKDKTILVYCQSGKRSNIAYNSLKEMGYDVYDMGAYDSIELEKE